MKLRMMRVGLALGGNALGLLVAAILLGDNMDINGAAFVLAVVIFTVLEVVLSPLIARTADRFIDVLSGGSALISTGLALAITDWISDGLSFDGVGGWLLATIIVWLLTAVIAFVLARVFLKDAIKQGAKR